MGNLVYLIGRLTQDIEVEEKENGKKLAIASIAVQRAYKNSEGVYDTDFFDIILYDGIAVNTAEYCKKGDLIGIKGRLQSNTYVLEGTTCHSIDMVAEKISFLSSKKSD